MATEPKASSLTQHAGCNDEHNKKTVFWILVHISSRPMWRTTMLNKSGDRNLVHYAAVAGGPCHLYSQASLLSKLLRQIANACNADMGH